MLATPIAAVAKDNNRHAQNNLRSAHVARFSNASPRRFAPAVVTRNELRNQRLGIVAARRNWRADRFEGNRGWGNANDYSNYGNGGYAPAYQATTPYYGAPGYAGGASCARAQRIVNVYQRDRATGHPAAAADLRRQNEWAFRGGCGGVAPTGGLFSGFNGAPAYNNYGYNGGYGQPYGATSMLAPLFQQFVH